MPDGLRGSAVETVAEDLAEALRFLVAVHDEKMGSSVSDALAEARAALAKAKKAGVRVRGL